MRIVPIRKIKKIDVVSKSRRRVVRNLGRFNVRSRVETQPVVLSPFVFKPRKSHFTFATIAFALIIVSSPLLLAFEAHVIIVTATLIQLDPPILTPPGDIGWDNLIGGTDLTGTTDVFFSAPDPDATHIYFTYGPGVDPNAVPNPVCGEPADLDGGGGDKIPIELIPLSLTSDTVIKAITCDGSTGSAHKSVTNIKIYTFQILFTGESVLEIDTSASSFVTEQATTTEDISDMTATSTPPVEELPAEEPVIIPEPQPSEATADEAEPTPEPSPEPEPTPEPQP